MAAMTTQSDEVSTFGMPSTRVVALAILTICYLGLIANREQTDRLASGLSIDLTAPTVSPAQIARDAILVAMVAWLAIAIPLHQGVHPAAVRISRPVVLAGIFVATSVTASLVRGTDAITVAVGLRGTAAIALLALIRHYSAEDRSRLLRLVATGLIPFVLIEAAVAIHQVMVGPVTLGRTAFGARPWGTFASANNLGLAMLAAALFLGLARPRGWRYVLVITAGTCLLSGSRTAVLGSVLVIAGMAVARWRSRGAWVPTACVCLVGIYAAASSAAVSGRSIEGEARLAYWKSSLGMLDGPTDWLIGKGAGVASNALVGLRGTHGVTGPAISDSTLMATTLSFGMLGLAGLLIGFVAVTRLIGFERRFVLIPAVALAALTFNVPELSPFNVLVALAVGCSLMPCKCAEITTGTAATAASRSSAPTGRLAVSSGKRASRSVPAARTFPG
jgi:hypothetical protein